MEQRSVTREEIIHDLEGVIEEIRSGVYPSVQMMVNMLVNERFLGNEVSECYQTGKQVMLVMRREEVNGN